MPRIAELRQFDGGVWARLEVPGEDESSITFWTDEEIAKFKHACIRDFLIDLFDHWKERQT